MLAGFGWSGLVQNLEVTERDPDFVAAPKQWDFKTT